MVFSVPMGIKSVMLFPNMISNPAGFQRFRLQSRDFMSSMMLSFFMLLLPFSIFMRDYLKDGVGWFPCLIRATNIHASDEMNSIFFSFFVLFSFCFQIFTSKRQCHIVTSTLNNGNPFFSTDVFPKPCSLKSTLRNGCLWFGMIWEKEEWQNMLKICNEKTVIKAIKPSCKRSMSLVERINLTGLSIKGWV